MSDQVTWNYVSLPADISMGYAAYAHAFDSTNTLAAGIQYINYGNFVETDATGNATGKAFTAGEYNIHVSYARTVGNFSVGGALKFIQSNLESFQSMGLAADIGGAWYDRDNKITVAGVISNFGQQLTTYRDGNNEALPLNVAVGITKGFKHNPLRFGLTLNHLNRMGSLLYQNSSRPGSRKDLETGQPVPEDLWWGKQAMAHVTLSGEIVLGKALFLGLGYNFLRQWEMQMDELSGFAGFSAGFGVKVSKFQFAYSYTGTHLAYGTNQFSFNIFVGEFFKK
jgi:hypothetical protein